MWLFHVIRGLESAECLCARSGPDVSIGKATTLAFGNRVFAIARLEQGRYDELRETAMTTERIEINPAIMMGRPVIRGTRITVELILRKLAEGESEGELLEDYPNLTTEDIRAAVAYGAASVAHEEIVLLPDTPALGKS
jgi:uncharacterized protein (DUF433 family)